MKLRRVMALFAKDLRAGPRSPMFLWAIALPLLISFPLQIVLVTFLEPLPRLAIADLGQSEITSAVRAMDRIELTLAANASEVRRLVNDNEVDAGLVLEPGFDAAVRAGERPELKFHVADESPIPSRLVLALTTIDLLRDVQGRPPPVEVEVRTAGNAPTLELSQLLVLCVLVFVLLVAAMFVPAFLLVEERERRTLDAVLVTPVQMSEVLMAKAALGFVMAMVMCAMTLALNEGLTGDPVALFLTMAVAAALCIEIGLVYGTTAKDAKTLYTLVKSLNILILGPIVFYVFPEWPQWIAKLFPTYWFIDPLYRITLQGASLRDVGPDLLVALVVIVVMAIPVALLGRRMQTRLASA